MPDHVVTTIETTETTCPQCGSETVTAALFVLPRGQTEGGWVCEEADCWANWSYGKPIDVGLPEPAPRALVAISEDRETLVVLPRRGGWWRAINLDERGGAGRNFGIAVDGGQDAHEVLREWLKGQGGTS